MNTLVERYVEQVCDGIHYKGHVKIADNDKLDYELVFAVPIPKLDDMELVKGIENIRKLFQITVKKNGASIELTNDEYGFFMHMLLEFAVRFYNEPQTRMGNDGIMGMMLRGTAPLAKAGVSTSIGMRGDISCDFPPNISEMLKQPKFGCALTT